VPYSPWSYQPKRIYPMKPRLDPAARCFGDDVRDEAKAAGMIGAVLHNTSDTWLIENWAERQEAKRKKAEPPEPAIPTRRMKASTKRNHKRKKKPGRVRQRSRAKNFTGKELRCNTRPMPALRLAVKG
jgi:hypothetical protein